jgi:hypothetical protein
MVRRAGPNVCLITVGNFKHFLNLSCSLQRGFVEKHEELRRSKKITGSKKSGATVSLKHKQKVSTLKSKRALEKRPNCGLWRWKPTEDGAEGRLVVLEVTFLFLLRGWEIS